MRAAWALALALVQPPFEEVRPALPFVLRNAVTAEKHQPETMPGGVALFDYDNDGRLDIFLVNGAPQPSLVKDSPPFHNRLFRNLGAWRFEDVTEKAGLAGEGYGMGVAAADFDNDGFTDLLVTSVGFSRLYRNRGDGAFEDVTHRARIPATPWPISAGWFDADNDGHLDLFLVNYCKWDPAREPFCGDARAGYRTYCHPKYYEGLPNTLLRNRGDGTFEDISASSGIARHTGKGMAVAFADYDHDGRLDILVTNDTTPNFLFHNDGALRFHEAGMAAGLAIADDGRMLSTMGADFRDTDNDGRPDVLLTALANETFPLFKNLGRGLFQEVTYRSRIGAASMPHSGWGAGLYDFDNDGWKDAFAANGDVQDNTERFSSRAARQRCQVFLNRGDGTYDSVLVGSAAQHRGVAFGDLDLDGRVDAVVARLGEAPALLRNVSGPANHYLRLALQGTRGNRDGLGARVRLKAAGREQWNHSTTAVGYLGSSEKIVHFGLSAADVVDELEVSWLSGATTRLEKVRAGQVLHLVEPR